MAKQTFTTGQVLTAAQMTSLQQTAMGGGAATAKTASYVLVAADAGTTVAMNAAGSTTITVNTGLFAAGDTVFIQNLGAGACTVTAGTATVATAGSLVLPQNDAGILYFTATGTAIFYDFIQVGAVSPLTTKGDLYTFSTSDTRLGVGANDTVLTADSAQATGLKWASVASGGMTLLGSGSLTGTSVTLSSIPQTYENLIVYCRDAVNASQNTVNLKVNTVGDIIGIEERDNNAVYQAQTKINFTIFQNLNTTNTDNSAFIFLPDYTAASVQLADCISYCKPTGSGDGNFISMRGAFRTVTAAITSITLDSPSSFSSGTYEIWGQK